jgi:hypothetical protein
VWAILADGPVGVARLVGLALHRRVLVAVGAAVAIVPFVTGRWSDLAVVVPCLAGGAVLIRVGLVRWPGLTAGSSPTPAPPPPPATGPSRLGRVGRELGRATGRELHIRLPRRARSAGRTVGRAWRSRP